jgi:YVTN family beta-propeller protein
VIKNISVGTHPTFIEKFGPMDVDPDAVYVANSGSNTVSLVDPLTNEEVAGMKFGIEPFGAGQIICDGLDAPINRFMFVTSSAKCVAKPTTGFEFSSWTQNLPQNTSVTINASTTSDWLVDPVAAFRDVFTDDPATTLTVNRFGNFTAYFKALPPTVPAEYIASLFTVVVTAIVGSLLIPSAISWINSKKQTSRLNSFHHRMAIVYSDGKLDENDTAQLDELNKNISDSYAAGKISNDQYTHLKNEISTAFQQIFKKRIESLTDQNIEAFSKIKRDLKDVYATGKIIELHYNLLNEQISDLLDNGTSKLE